MVKFNVAEWINCPALFKRFLEIRDLIDTFVDYYLAYHPTGTLDGYLDDLRSSTYWYAAVTGAFPVRRTREGADYWIDLDNQWTLLLSDLEFVVKNRLGLH